MTSKLETFTTRAISISQGGSRWHPNTAADQDALESLGLKPRFDTAEIEMVLYCVSANGYLLEAVPEEL